MNDQQILASPNWYNSAISDISLDGIFAYGAKNTVFLLDLTGPGGCQYFGQLCGHKDRVTSVQFCKISAYSRCCVSASDDLSVIIWDIDAKELVSKHNRHEAQIAAVFWSRASCDWIYSGDDKGNLLSWNHQLNEVYEHSPLTGQINCISCPPDEEDVIVVGYKTGQIFILLLQKEKHKIVTILKGHNDEIHSLVWSPVPARDLPQEIFGVPKRQDSGYILASGSRDKTIRLWNVSLGQFIAVVQILSKSSKGKTSRDDYHMRSRLWNTLCWPRTDPTCLISSSFNGDILAWNLSKNSKQKWQLFDESKHHRIVFSICHWSANDVLISVSMDRQIHIWNRRDATVITSLPSCGGFVYSLDVSVLDPSRLAVGVGDNVIRIWDTAAQGSSHGVTNLWRGIGTKVMKVLWHPVKEGQLAFGTEEGKVGVYNVMSQTCNVSRIYHKKSVYSLSWGPSSDSSDGTDDKIWHLYSCGGEGTILEHDPDHLHGEAKNVDQLIKATNGIKHNLAGHSEVSCKPDRSLMAIGNEDGSIIFYRFPDLKLLSTVNIHKKNITCLAWYRTHDSNDPKSNFLASGSNGFDVHVHDLKYIVEGRDDGDPKVITGSYRWLSGHTSRVTDVVWSVHSFSQLASSSYDGTVQVWDVVKGEPLVNYRGHSGRVMTVAWSLMDPDVMFSGSDDFTVRSWRISQQVFKEPPMEVKKPAKSKTKKKKSKTTSGANQKTKLELVADEPAEPSGEKQSVDEKAKSDVKTGDLQLEANSKSHTDVPESFNLLVDCCRAERHENYASVAAEPLAGGKVDTKRKKKKGKSMFPLSALGDNKTRSITSLECVDIAKFVTNSTGCSEDGLHISAENVNLGLFADRKSAFDMLSEEGIHHAENGNTDYQLQLEIWKGNIGKALELAVEKKHLSDWLVAISHLAGEQVRLVVTEAFAEQLASQGSFHRAAVYYLACHKVYEAINMFKTAGMYREAIALAKVRLLPTDPLLLDLYSSWGRRLESEYSFEQASKCYLACGLHDDAIRVLTRRGDEIALHSAAQIAKLSERIDLSLSIILQCALMATKKARWNDALQMVHDYPDMQQFLMVLFAHKTILVSLLKSGAITSADFPEMQSCDVIPNSDLISNLPQFVLKLKAEHERRSIDSTSGWRSTSGDDSCFVYKIMERWWSDCGLHMHETRLPGLYVQISTLGSSHSFSSKDDIGNVLMIVSKNMCLGLVAAMLAKFDICIEHFLKAITDCHESGNYRLVCHLVRLLFPFGLESWYMIKRLSESHGESSLDMTDQYFCNIMAFYHRAILSERLASDELRENHEESVQSCAENDTGECSSFLDTTEPGILVTNMDDVGTSCREWAISQNADQPQLTNCSLNNSSVTHSTKDDYGSARDHTEKENNNISRKTSFQEIYRIGLVCSTVLLSDIYAQFQTLNKDIEKGENLKDGDSRQKTELEISLSNIPFPNVAESAHMLVELLDCIITSKDAREVNKIMASELSQQVSFWANARKLNVKLAVVSDNVDPHKQQ